MTKRTTFNQPFHRTNRQPRCKNLPIRCRNISRRLVKPVQHIFDFLIMKTQRISKFFSIRIFCHTFKLQRIKGSKAMDDVLVHI